MVTRSAHTPTRSRHRSNIILKFKKGKGINAQTFLLAEQGGWLHYFLMGARGFGTRKEPPCSHANFRCLCFNVEMVHMSNVDRWSRDAKRGTGLGNLLLPLTLVSHQVMDLIKCHGSKCFHRRKNQFHLLNGQQKADTGRSLWSLGPVEESVKLTSAWSTGSVFMKCTSFSITMLKTEERVQMTLMG